MGTIISKKKKQTHFMITLCEHNVHNPYFFFIEMCPTQMFIFILSAT